MSQFLSKKHVLYDSRYFARMDRFSRTEKYKQELDCVLDLLQVHKGQLVLDLGCNTGNPASYVSVVADCRVVGIDFPVAVQSFWRARKVYFIRGDGHYLPFRSDTFDHAYVMHTIGHVRDPGVVLGELQRVLRPHGRVALVTPNRWFVWAMKPLNYLRIIKHTPDPTVLRYYSVASLCRELTGAGFTVLKAFTHGALPDLLSFLENRKSSQVFRERVVVVAGVEDPSARK